MKRLKALRTTLSEKNIPSILISRAENRYYLSGFSGSSGYLLITADRQLLGTDFRYVEQVKQQSPDFSLFETKGEVAKWLPDFIGGLGLKEIYFEAGELTFEMYSKFNEILSPVGISFKPSTGIVEDLRCIKEPAARTGSRNSGPARDAR